VRGVLAHFPARLFFQSAQKAFVHRSPLPPSPPSPAQSCAWEEVIGRGVSVLLHGAHTHSSASLTLIWLVGVGFLTRATAT
jgi:hypothetical protein